MNSKVLLSIIGIILLIALFIGITNRNNITKNSNLVQNTTSNDTNQGNGDISISAQGNILQTQNIDSQKTSNIVPKTLPNE